MMTVYSMNTGVPHVVHLVEGIEDYPVAEMGREIRRHTMFAPEGTNADFVGGDKEKGFRIRTYERGVEEETLACGTGTVASAVTLGLLGYAESPVSLKTQSGEALKVYFKLNGEKVTDVFLEGNASIICEGNI